MSQDQPTPNPVDHLAVNWIAVPCGTPRDPYRLKVLPSMRLTGPSLGLGPDVWRLDNSTAVRYRAGDGRQRCWLDAVEELEFEAYVDTAGGPFGLTPVVRQAQPEPDALRQFFLAAFDEDMRVTAFRDDASLAKVTQNSSVVALPTTFIAEITQYIYASALDTSLAKSRSEGARAKEPELFHASWVSQAIPTTWDAPAQDAAVRSSGAARITNDEPKGNWSPDDKTKLLAAESAVRATLKAIAPTDFFVFPSPSPDPALSSGTSVALPCPSAPTLYALQESAGALIRKYALPTSCSMPLGFKAATNNDAQAAWAEVRVQGGGSISALDTVHVPPRGFAEFEHSADEGWLLHLLFVPLLKEHLGRTIMSGSVTADSDTRMVFGLPTSSVVAVGDVVTIENIGSNDTYVVCADGALAPDKLPEQLVKVEDVARLLAAAAGAQMRCWIVPTGTRIQLHRVTNGGAPSWLGRSEELKEFHALVAQLGTHAAVLRMFNLCIELQLSEEGIRAVQALPANQTHRIKVCVSRKQNASHPSLESVVHWTAFRRFADRQGSWWALAARDDALVSIDHGLLSKKFSAPGRFQLVQFDTETSALKMTQAATSVYAAQQVPRPPISVATDNLPDRGKTPPPALVSTGIGLYDSQTETVALNALGGSARLSRALNEVLQKSQRPLVECTDSGETIYAEEAIQGFCVDARMRYLDHSCGSWIPLSEREVRYWFGQRDERPPDFKITECAPTGSSAQERQLDSTGAPGELVTSQAIFQWRGWNLGLPQPGRALDPSGRKLTPKKPAPRTGSVIIEYGPTRTLPLRNSAEYDFRLRPVDIGCGSLSIDDADELIGSGTVIEDDCTFRSRPITRVEPVVAPKIVPLTLEQGPKSDTVLVVRSFDNGRRERKEWILVPPPANFDQVAQHGVFDMLSIEELSSLLRKHSHELPDASATLTAEQWKEQVKRWKITLGELSAGRVPFLADPLSSGAAFSCLPNSKCRAILEFAKPSQYKRYPIPRLPLPDRISPVALRLIAGTREATSCSRDKVTITLPPGRSWTCDLSSSLPKDFVSLFAIANWIFGPNAGSAFVPSGATKFHDEISNGFVTGIGSSSKEIAEFLVDAAESGQLSMVTPAKAITFVHAVQRPLVPEHRDAIEFVSDDFGTVQALREAGESLVTLVGAIHIDCPSTARLDLGATWSDKVDDPAQPSFDSTFGTAAAFETSVPQPSDRCRIAESHDYGVLPEDLRAKIADRARIPDGGFPFVGVHKWNDLKHHVVSYVATATSRFADHYPELGTQPAAFTRTSKPVVIHVPSAAPPDKPAPFYAVPLFVTQSEGGSTSFMRTREGGHLRLYLKRGWFSSGDDEELAIVLTPAGGPLLTGRTGQMITEWGSDPIWQSSPLPTYPTLQNIVGAKRLVRGYEMSVPVEAEAALPNGNKVRTVEQLRVDLATFEVKLDPERNLLYCDLRIDTGLSAAYMPFVRMALARYQPYAATGCALSPVVQAHFTQLSATRSATVHRLTRDRLRISVVGPSEQATPPREVVEVSFEGREIGPEGATFGWFPLDPGAYPTRTLARQQNGDGSAVWWGELDRPSFGSPLRAVIKGFQLLETLKDNSNPAGEVILAKRLVYVDTLEL